MATTNGNGGVFKWIAGSLMTALILVFGLGVRAIDSKVDSLKADSVMARREIRADVVKNADNISKITVDLALIQYRTDEIKWQNVEIMKMLRDIQKKRDSL